MATMGSRGMMMCLKKAWNDWPDLVCTLAMTGVGTVLLGAFLYKSANMGDKKYMYKMHYTVIREEDVDDPKKIGTIYN